MAGISAVFPDQIPIGAISGTAAAPSFAQCRHTGRPQPVNRAVSQCWFGRSCADASDPGQPDDRDERRKQHPLDVQFIAGIREHGVLQPITAIRTDGVELRDGQRRAHAARQVGLATRVRGIRIVNERALATSDVVSAKSSGGYPGFRAGA